MGLVAALRGRGFWAVVVVLAGAAAALLWLDGRVRARESHSGEVKALFEEKPGQVPLSVVLAKIVEGSAGSRAFVPVPVPQTDDQDSDASLDQAIAALELGERELRMLNALGQDEAGRRLSRALLSESYPDRFPGGAAPMRQFILGVNADPEEGSRILAEGLERLRDFDGERARLLDILARLQGAEQERRRIALQEMENAGGDSPARADRALASQYILLTSEGRPDEALQGTVAAITAQHDAGVRRRLARQFLFQFPRREGDLDHALARVGINLRGLLK